MTTNFFKNIADLQTSGNFNMTIQASDSGKLTVSVLLSNAKVKENAVKSIPPLLLKGTPQELDEGFFDAVVEPLLQTETLIQNIADYQKAQEKVKTISTGSKTKTDAPKDDIEVLPKPNKEEKKREYTDAIRKIVELTGLCKFEEALAILPSITDFPDKEAEILKRKSDLERMNAQRQLLWNDKD